jgi:NAD(P)-dependent dehydrogenase (short-subunit alcohol dehydrogenase family)
MMGMLEMGFSGRVALVVGATGAIGARTAQLFAQSGAKVVLAGRSMTALAAVASGIEGASTETLCVACDVTDPDSMERVVTDAVARFGRVDAAFNNAGWEGAAVESADISEDDWAKMMDIKLSGTWRGLKFQVRQMIAQGDGGSIVNMAGNWGLIGFPQYASYCAAAHGVMGLTRSAALEYAGRGIRVNAVCPGAVDTPMLSRMIGGNEAVKGHFAAAIPMGRLAYPDDVARAVLWLCSDNASYITGQGIMLTGGAQ